jgi:L-asparaginase
MASSIGRSGSLRPRTPPLEVRLLRNGIAESLHRVHAVVCDQRGRQLMRAGDPQMLSFIRSGLKPFQAQVFVSSGAADAHGGGERALAIACASHDGNVAQAREAFQVLWRADVDVALLRCPCPAGADSPLQHNCSGKHAAFLAACKRLGWPLEGYLNRDHPLQQEVLNRVAELLGLPAAELVVACDDCGAPTLQLPLAQMALLYAHLGSGQLPTLERLGRAMQAFPELVAGEGRFDTELMRRSLGVVVSKGGAEGIQCLARMGEGLGLAIKVEDGSGRAKWAVALHLLRQLDWLTPSALEELEQQFLIPMAGQRLEVLGELRFEGS